MEPDQDWFLQGLENRDLALLKSMASKPNIGIRPPARS
jgi:hypothetical protein